MDDIKKSHEEVAQKARTALRAAADEMHGAIAAYQAAADRLMRAELRLCDDAVQGVYALGRHIYSNTASASGGPTHPRNVMEAIQRDVAITLLNSQVNKL